MKIKILDKRLYEGHCWGPKKPGDAGLDLKISSVDYDGLRMKIMAKLGVAVEIPTGWVGLLMCRSSRSDACPRNAVGVIDSGYRGELMAEVDHHKLDRVTDKAAFQLVIVPSYDLTQCVVVDELSDSVRGEGGFGSSDK